VGGRGIELQDLDQAGQAGSLAGGQLQDQTGQGGGVDDRVLEGCAQPASHQPGIEGVVAVLDQDGAPGEAQEGPPGVAELGRADQHLAVDQVAAAGVGVDRRPAVDQGVEEGQGAGEPESLGPDLQDQEGAVAGGLHVQGHELGLLQERLRTHLGLHQEVLPEHPGAGPRLEEDLPGWLQ
jgi:hypothetical protein